METIPALPAKKSTSLARRVLVDKLYGTSIAGIDRGTIFTVEIPDGWKIAKGKCKGGDKILCEQKLPIVEYRKINIADIKRRIKLQKLLPSPNSGMVKYELHTDLYQLVIRRK